MKLSEAIREGAKLRPQCRGELFRYINPVHGWLSCALGAALEGLGVSPPAEGEDWDSRGKVPDETLCHSFPFLYIPESGEQRDLSPLGLEIIDRNDKQGQSREEIADWLEAQGL